MSFHSPDLTFPEVESLSISQAEFSSSQDQQSDTSRSTRNGQGFSSSLVLNFENDPSRQSRPCSKLINVTQVTPGSSKVKKMLLPVFYKKNTTSPSKLFLENSFNVAATNESFLEEAKGRKDLKDQKDFNDFKDLKDLKDFKDQKDLKDCRASKEYQKRAGKVTSTTIGSMHTLSNLDGETNHEIFGEKVQYEYEKDLKSSLTDGNLFAFCHKCKKETVCVMKPEKDKSLVDLLFCCCSNWNIKAKSFMCPACFEVLLKLN
jgi:hypothetical protein